MRTSLKHDEYRLDFHAGRTDGRICLTLAVTNRSDEPVSPSSGMGAWGSIRLVDEHGTRRLEATGSTAAVTTWTIPPGKSLISQRVTDTPADIEQRDTPRIEYVTDPDAEAVDENRHYAPNVGLPEEETVTMTARGAVDLTACASTLSLTFSPEDLSAPIDAEVEYDIAENPRADRASPFDSTDTGDYSARDIYKDEE